jgi:predicted adenine nucleotide alpha hydrolase (AANH) superfamily ATPase
MHLIGINKNSVYFKITQTDDLKQEKVYLGLQIRGVVYSIATGLLKKELVFKIPLQEVPQGIAEVTLFNEKLEPLVERLVFVNQEQKLIIKAELNQTGFTTRDKANLKIKVTDKDGKPVVAHLGVSVYDALYQNKQDSKNIESHYFLSTQLKGNVYDPAYYFNEKNNDCKQALNLLLLTQGWRNYVWNENNLNEQLASPPIVFDEWKGRIRFERMKKNLTKSVGKQAILVATANDKLSKYFITTDSTGVFTAGSKEFKRGEGGYVYLELKSDEKSNYRSEFSGNFFEEINNNRKNKNLVYPVSAQQEIKTEAASPFIGRATITKLKEVAIISKSKKVFRDKYLGRLDSLARLDRKSDYRCINGILNCTNHPEPRFNFRDLTEAELLELFNVVMIEGYYGKKEFYEAVYDEVTITDSLPDFRNTLFWKSDLITDINGEANVEFFCSDINSLFIGNIEGVSGNGLLGADNFEFKVRKKGN